MRVSVGTGSGTGIRCGSVTQPAMAAVQIARTIVLIRRALYGFGPTFGACAVCVSIVCAPTTFYRILDSVFSLRPMANTPRSGVTPALSAVAAFVLASCVSPTEPVIPEDNVGFHFRTNLPCVRAEVNGRDATLVVASALPRTAIASSLKGERSAARILLSSTLFTHVRPAALDVADLPADGLLGADAFRGRIATIDYFRGLLVISAWPKAQPDAMPWSFSGGPPRVPVVINGRATWAIVDTALPDTAVIPGELVGTSNGSRGTVSLEIAGIRFENLDVAINPVVTPRLGNRVLYRFVVTIDYAHERIGLWPDPRTSDAPLR